MDRQIQMTTARVKNAPGGMTIITHLSQYGDEKYGTAKPQTVPIPRISRIAAIRISTKEYPNPLKKPSTADEIGGLLPAYASQRPMIIQLVMISPT
jgi:hypothetical protein